MLSSLFDEYSLNARVRPALLALLPAIFFVYVAFPQLYELVAGAMSILVIGGFITLLAHFSRNRGRTVEQGLFSVWGGKPTTVMLRHRDDHIDLVTKRRYHKFLANNIENWSAPTEEEEFNDPLGADHTYDSAVKWLLEYARDQKQYAMLFKENISYGFRRNCYGIRWLGIFFASVPIIVCVIDLVSANISIMHSSVITTLVAVAFSFFLLFWWLFQVNKAWVKDAAVAYAVRLLAACEKVVDS
jgi:hypothetical protein